MYIILLGFICVFLLVLFKYRLNTIEYYSKYEYRNRTIYLTYYKDIPDIVFNRWKVLNKNYNVELHLDNQCIQFLKAHFNDYVVNLFKTIPRGMYKADLWRLCKLYIHSGVYSDVDIVPYINIDTLDSDITFYSSLSIDKDSIFQAFMVNRSKPQNPLLLHFIISFLVNKPYYNPHNGPTYDMYKCLQYNIGTNIVKAETKYKIDTIKIKIEIGQSDTNIKKIDLCFFPHDIDYTIQIKKHPHKDIFHFNIKNNILTVQRIDKQIGWGYHHTADIRIPSNETIYLFTENIGNNHNWITSYVSNKGVKLLDSRDLTYHKNGGW